MEFNVKLQQLRKHKGLTQEELAQALYVSRTAISKWESGRGYPNIESLKAMAKFFCVTIDELLSGDELLTIAEEDHKQKHARDQSLIFGLLDFSTAMYLFLPIFGEASADSIRAVSLLSLSMVSSYLRIAYWGIVIGMTTIGILTLTLQCCPWQFWMKHKTKISLFVHAAGALIYIISSQPYAAAILFVLLIIKSAFLFKTA